MNEADVAFGAWLESLDRSKTVQDYNTSLSKRFSREERFRFFWMKKRARKEQR